MKALTEMTLGGQRYRLTLITPTGDAGEVPHCCTRAAWEASPAGQLAAMQMQRDSAEEERDYFERQGAEARARIDELEQQVIEIAGEHNANRRALDIARDDLRQARAELAERDKGQCPQCDRYFNALRRKDDDVARLTLELAKLRDVSPGWAAELGDDVYAQGDTAPPQYGNEDAAAWFCGREYQQDIDRTEAAQHRHAELSEVEDRFKRHATDAAQHGNEAAAVAWREAARIIRNLLQGAGTYPTVAGSATVATWAERFAADRGRAWRELCADLPEDAWLAHVRDDGKVEWRAGNLFEGVAHGWDAAIIPAAANNGQELVVTRPGLEWSEDLPGHEIGNDSDGRFGSHDTPEWCGKHGADYARIYGFTFELQHPVTGDPVRVEVPRG